MKGSPVAGSGKTAAESLAGEGESVHTVGEEDIELNGESIISVSGIGSELTVHIG